MNNTSEIKAKVAELKAKGITFRAAKRERGVGRSWFQYDVVQAVDAIGLVRLEERSMAKMMQRLDLLLECCANRSIYTVDDL